MINLKHDIKEFSVIIIMSLVLLVISMWIVFYIVKNYVDVNSIFGGNFSSKVIYILKDDKTKSIKSLITTISKNYKVKDISYQELSHISTNSVLLLINDKNISSDLENKIKNYVYRGGKLIFNSKNKNFLFDITKMTKSGELYSNSYYLQSKILSPLQIKKTKIGLYETIPLYNNKNSILDLTKNYNSYGVVWNGNYHKGSWLYFSFPSYLFSKNKVQKLFLEMINYEYNGFKVIKYPYINKKKMLLIDEYIDYDFNDEVIKLIDNLGLRATIFINPKIVKKEINFSKNIEIASMSIKDKYLLQKHTTQKIVGFSNENYKGKIKSLKEMGFDYIFTKNMEKKVDKDNFVIISNNGFNDINLEVNIKKIKKQIDFSLNYGLYSLTIHSYVLGYKSNLGLLKNILNLAKHYHISTAKEIASIYIDTKNISITTSITSSSLLIKIINNSLKEINNFTFRVYSKYKLKTVSSNFFNIDAKIIKTGKNYVDIRVKKMSKNIEFYLRIKK